MREDFDKACLNAVNGGSEGVANDSSVSICIHPLSCFLTLVTLPLGLEGLLTRVLDLSNLEVLDGHRKLLSPDFILYLVLPQSHLGISLFFIILLSLFLHDDPAKVSKSHLFCHVLAFFANFLVKLR
jgi:hypothetical protein